MGMVLPKQPHITQNSRYWSADDPRLIHKFLLHNFKVGVWCTNSVTRIIKSIFFLNTINSQRYNGQIFPLVFQNLIRRGTTCSSSRMVQLSIQHVIQWLSYRTCLGPNNKFGVPGLFIQSKSMWLSSLWKFERQCKWKEFIQTGQT
jgi:hypothetical protein